MLRKRIKADEELSQARMFVKAFVRQCEREFGKVDVVQTKADEGSKVFTMVNFS